ADGDRAGQQHAEQDRRTPLAGYLAGPPDRHAAGAEPDDRHRSLRVDREQPAERQRHRGQQGGGRLQALRAHSTPSALAPAAAPEATSYTASRSLAFSSGEWWARAKARAAAAMSSTRSGERWSSRSVSAHASTSSGLSTTLPAGAATNGRSSWLLTTEGTPSHCASIRVTGAPPSLSPFAAVRLG